MTTGVGTPIAVFSLGLGPLIGAAVEGVSAAAPLVTAGVEAASAAIPAATAAVEGVSALAPSAVAAAEAIGTTGPMIANVMQGVAPGAVEGVTAGAGLLPTIQQGASKAIPQALAEGAKVLPSGAGSVAQSGAGAVTPESIMAQMAGNPMSVQPPATFAEGGPLVGDVASGGISGEPSVMAGAKYPTAPGKTLAESSWRDNPWVKKGGKALRQFAKSGASQQEKGAQQQAPPPPNYGGPVEHNPYRSGHVAAQRATSQSIMDDYLSSGGAFYG